MTGSGRERPHPPLRPTPADLNKMGESLTDSWRAYQRVIGPVGEPNPGSELEVLATKVESVIGLAQAHVVDRYPDYDYSGLSRRDPEGGSRWDITVGGSGRGEGGKSGTLKLTQRRGFKGLNRGLSFDSFLLAVQRTEAGAPRVTAEHRWHRWEGATTADWETQSEVADLAEERLRSLLGLERAANYPQSLANRDKELRRLRDEGLGIYGAGVQWGVELRLVTMVVERGMPEEFLEVLTGAGNGLPVKFIEIDEPKPQSEGEDKVEGPRFWGRRIVRNPNEPDAVLSLAGEGSEGAMDLSEVELNFLSAMLADAQPEEREEILRDHQQLLSPREEPTDDLAPTEVWSRFEQEPGSNDHVNQ